jgi:hypothetical protein
VITIDDGVFMPEGDDGEAAETVTAVGMTHQTIGDALTEVGHRCEAVDELGREYGVDPDVDREVDAWLASLDESHWPRRAHWSRVVESPLGLQLHLDCKQEVTLAMASTFRQILVEVLEQWGFDDVHIIVSPDPDDVPDSTD